ncbi:hypothetical protein [Simplicispira psychrophila]|uniref:hypothetical protein n=1 Tax=Simplicispira psychrophila TaxID=80882 RepID=UPI0004803C71|nr:hypothetical protein [Simplicispira psychrophila]
MSFFSWFMRKPSVKRRSPQPSAPLNAGAPVSQPGRTHKPSPVSPVPEQAAATKNERMERRELLYIVVRDAMVCAGVLSASYKFKVLSLDPRGLQFLVMMDLAREFGGETVRLSEIETLIAQTAKARYNIAVTAVYWRINELVGAGVAQKVTALPAAHAHHSPATGARVPDVARPAPSSVAVRPSMPAPLDRPSAAAAPVRLVAPRFDPIEADEVAAFKQALAAAAAARTPAAPTPGVPQRSGPRRPAPSSDFADTVMPEQDSRAQSLSNTQYGEL